MKERLDSLFLAVNRLFEPAPERLEALDRECVQREVVPWLLGYPEAGGGA